MSYKSDIDYSVLRFGIVTNIDESIGRVRVSLKEEGIITPFLAVAVPFTVGDKSLFMPKVNEQVAVLLDCRFEAGVVVGGIYTKTNTPGFDQGQSGIKYENGSEITHKDGEVFIKGSQKATIEGESKVSVKNSGDSLASILSDLLEAMALETHNVTAVGAPTGPPINVAQYNAIKARINAMME